MYGLTYNRNLNNTLLGITYYNTIKGGGGEWFTATYINSPVSTQLNLYYNNIIM